jgi:hypothetical protein
MQGSRQVVPKAAEAMMRLGHYSNVETVGPPAPEQPQLRSLGERRRCSFTRAGLRAMMRLIKATMEGKGAVIVMKGPMLPLSTPWNTLHAPENHGVFSLH